MATTVVYGVYRMQKRNELWAEALRNLLKRHNLSLRGAERRAEHEVTKSYLSEWLQGKVPTYATAVRFLSHFPTYEAIPVLEAAGYPPPPEWGEISGADRVRERVAEYIVDRGVMTENEIKEMWREIERSEDSDNEQ